jgi:hypothetical protein
MGTSSIVMLNKSLCIGLVRALLALFALTSTVERANSQAVKQSEVDHPAIFLQHEVIIPIHLQAILKKQDRFRPAVAAEVWAASQTVCINFAIDQCWSMSAPHQEEHSLRFSQSGRYIVYGYPPSGTYFASLTCGTTDLLRERLQVAEGQPKCVVEAVLRDDPASIEVDLSPGGLAEMADSEAKYASLILIPLDNPIKMLPFERVVFKGSETAKVDGISPGTYLAVVLNLGSPQVGVLGTLPPTPPNPRVAYRDPVVFERLRKCGKKVTLQPEEQARLEVGWCVVQ